MGFLATHAKTGPAAVFADGDRRADDLDLLHNARGKVEQPGAAAAVGTDGERVIDPLVDFFGRKRRPLVPRMARLPTPLPFAAADTARSWRLDDVARRWFGRIGGGLLRRGQLHLQGGKPVLKNRDALLKRHTIRTAMIPRRLHPAKLHDAHPC